MENSSALIKVVEEHGWSWLLALAFVWVVLAIFREFLKHYGNNDKIERAIQGVEKTAANVDKSLNILNQMLEHHRDMYKIIIDKNDVIKNRLALHDDRSEKIYTQTIVNGLTIQELLSDNMGNKEAKEMVEEFKAKAKEKLELQKEREENINNE